MPCGSKDSSQQKGNENGHCAFEDLDHSVLQQPLNLGVTNVKQILKCVESGSKEVKDIVLNECNIIYECKVCVGLFRSLANFIYHKRCYCKKHLCEEMVLFDNFEEPETITVIPESPAENKSKSTDTVKESSKLHNLVECTVDLIKTDVDLTKLPYTKEKNADASEKMNKIKAKQIAEMEKKENSMVSRRTRDKKVNNPVSVTAASRISLETSDTEEPPMKCAKLLPAKNIEKQSNEKSDVNNKPTEIVELDASSKEEKIKKINIPKLSSPFSKNLTPYPKKIIFKTIESNPHAVYQSNDKKKLDSFENRNSKHPFGTKVDNEKLIIVLKKPEDSKSSETKKADPEKFSDFHLTRRKRLMSRTDCNVHDLKCLTCKTQFMSLKTLYFHMLSLHSKKRLYYPCPFCKSLFVQLYGVTRHLISIHNKTKEQINKLRDVIKKKSVWKKIEDVSPTNENALNSINCEVQNDNQQEFKSGTSKPAESDNAESDALQSVIKLGKNVTLHQCSKCNRLFGRKSSQVSHQKFCIMNTIKPDLSDSAVTSQSSNSSNVVSFLSLSPAKNASCTPSSTTRTNPSTDNIENRFISSVKEMLGTRVSARPKRGAEKQMHKDFVNSQTLKWRSANRIDTNSNKVSPVKKNPVKGLEKKVLSIMDVENLLCTKCNRTFSSYSNLRRHVAIHVGWTRFKCKFCDYQAYNKSQCWTHVQKAHNVDDSEMDKSIENLVSSNVKNKKTNDGHNTSLTKRNPSVNAKTSNGKNDSIPKVKICKKKNSNSAVKNLTSDEKKVQINKKENLNVSEIKKEILAVKKELKKEEIKKESMEIKKDLAEIKKNKFITISLKTTKRDINDIKEKPKAVISIQKFPKKDMLDAKKESQSLIPIQKFTAPEYKKEANYKSVTTNNPTTIILSKKVPNTVQSIVTLSPAAVSCSKISPLRSSPRKSDIKSSGVITTLVTRSSAYSKSSPIQIKLPSRSNSVDDIKDISEKSPMKERLISEWFPKKDVSSNMRRESAPVIIGVVPESRAKNSTAEIEKSSP